MAIADSTGNVIPFDTYVLNAHKMLIALEFVCQKRMKQLSALYDLARSIVNTGLRRGRGGGGAFPK